MIAAVAVAAALALTAPAVDATDGKVSKAEARQTSAGETRHHVAARIGPVDTVRYPRTTELRVTWDYRTYRPHYAWRVYYRRDDVGAAWRVSFSGWLHCPHLCVPAS